MSIILHPNADSYRQRAAAKKGAAAEILEGMKNGKCRQPAVFESYGRCGERFKTWFDAAVQSMEDRLPQGWATTWAAHSFSAHFQQRASAALQIGNAKVIT